MKSKKIQQRINETLKFIDIHSRHVNCIRLHKSTNRAHRKQLFNICSWLLDNNYSFVTEAKFVVGGRADIVVLETGDAYEIMDTETMKQFNAKRYPIPVYPIGVNEEWRGL